MSEGRVVTYGTSPDHASARVVTKEAHRVSPAEGQITRTRDCFQFPPSPGVFMLDHDGTPGKEISPDDLRAALVAAAPVLAGVPMLWRASASSCITASNGTALTGLSGQRLYIPVQDARLIPEAGKALVDLLWAAGLGHIGIGCAGQALERTLIDAAVWQPERLDFAAPPVMCDGLTRKPPAPRFFNESAAWLGLGDLIAAADGSIKAVARKARAEAKRAAKPIQDKAREAWINEHAPALAALRKIPEEQARGILMRASEKHLLMGDFMLKSSDGSDVSVGDVLDNPERWHGTRFGDPLDPGYRNDHRVAWANLRSGSRPFIFSHAHGGVHYTLARPSARIQLSRGQKARVVDSLLDLLRQRGELFDFGEGAGLVRVTGGRVSAVSRDWLADHFDRIAEFYTVKILPEGEPKESAQDAPPAAAIAIIAKNGDRRLPKLTAVITAPILRVDGSILSEPGHDASTGLLYLSASGDTAHIPEHPTIEQACAAFARLWEPVRLFPLADDVDRGVVLAALITACLRPSLPTAPGFGFDAPAAGTGKTLLAQTIGALGCGDAPAAMPPASNQDEECRKRLFASLRDGHKILLWDNVRDVFGNAAIDAFLTASVFADRVLGASETASLPNRALFLVTGNNLRLVGDTCRRILVARLDAKDDKPYARRFNFDPLQTVLGRRESLVIDALTIVRAYRAAGSPRLAPGRTASFEDWDDLVRQPVVWVAKFSLLWGLPSFADPLGATDRAFELDPETAKLAALMAAWGQCFGDRPTTVAEAVARTFPAAGAPASAALADALEEIAGERGTINRRILGRWIEKQTGRRQQGQRFERGSVRAGSTTWILRTEKRPTTADISPPPGSVVGLVGYGGLLLTEAETTNAVLQPQPRPRTAAAMAFGPRPDPG